MSPDSTPPAGPHIDLRGGAYLGLKLILAGSAIGAILIFVLLGLLFVYLLGWSSSRSVNAAGVLTVATFVVSLLIGLAVFAGVYLFKSSRRQAAR